MIVSSANKSIKSIGNHLGTNMLEVKAFHIYNSPSCHYIPSGIHDFFSNIEVLTVNFCGLKTVTKEDLRPLQHLKGLYLQNNQLTSLGNELFAENPLIEEINLCDNKLKHISPNVFVPLKYLRKIEVLRNLCIDESAIKSTEVEILIRNFKEKCPPIVTHLPEIENPENHMKTTTIHQMGERIKKLESIIETLIGNICNMREDKIEL